jgi:GNAT superfamily N-acetyltransferase
MLEQPAAEPSADSYGELHEPVHNQAARYRDVGCFRPAVREAQRNGVWRCWCTWFHPRRKDLDIDVEAGRPYKEFLVREGKAHAALVFDGDVAVGWCQFGTPEELPCIFHRKEYEAGLVSWPDYRLTCIFVDRNHRREGVAAVALDGALNLIARSGGGVVEAYPQDTAGKKIPSSFLYDGTRSMFEKAGFDYERPKGKNHCVMRKIVPAA